MEITRLITESIRKKKPISFCKYGDGEYYCASGDQGGNCDCDMYTPKLKEGLIRSFKFMADKPDSYLGLWVKSASRKFWESLVNRRPNWALYHTIILDKHHTSEKLELLKTIKESKLNKVIVCNELLIKSQILLNINHIITIPLRNWYDNQFDNIAHNCRMVMRHDEPNIVITCAGMGAKVLIATLKKDFPNSIYLDFGSAIDKICTKKTTRGWEPTYDELMNLLKDIIPSNWNDPKYDYIYQKANNDLGIHIN